MSEISPGGPGASMNREYWLGRLSDVPGLSHWPDRAILISGKFFKDIGLALESSAVLRSIEEDFDVLLGNYIELDAYLLTVAAETRLGRPLDQETDDHRRRNAQRRVANILTSARAFIDHSLHSSSRLLGSGSPGYVAVKSAFSAQYDGLMGYRFLEAIRNHAQHAGVSVDSLMYMRGPYPDPGGGESPAFGIEPALSLRHLRENPGFKKAVLGEMELHAQGGELLLSRCVREYVFGLYQALVQVRSILESVRSGSLSVLGDAIDRFVASTGALTPEGATAFATEGGHVVEVHRLSVIDLGRVSMLRGTNFIRSEFVASKIVG